MSETEIETRAWEVQPVYEAGVLQPWNQVIFPSADSNWPVWGGMTSALLKSIPAIGRAYELIEGMAAQMALDDVKGDRILPRPQLLDDPDPEMTTDLRRTLYSLYGVLRLHNAMEEEGAFSLVERQ